MNKIDSTIRDTVLRRVRIDLENKQRVLNRKRADRNNISQEIAGIEKDIARLKAVEGYFEELS